MELKTVGWFILVSQICFIPIFAFLLRNAWIQRAHAEALAGELVLKVPRPQAKRWETALFICNCVILLGQGAKGAYLVAVSRPIPVLEFWSALNWSLLMLMVIGFSLVSRGTAYLEFREHGIVYLGSYCPWESIRKWDWTGHGFTLRLKLRHAIVSFRLRPGDKGAVQEALEKHVIEPSVAI